jgi:hypothetical protein
MGFHVGVVSNAYWATSEQDALRWLESFVGLIQDLSISSDLYHYREKLSQQAKNACAAAEALGIPVGIIAVAPPEAASAADRVGQLPESESAVMFRGRAVEKLASRAAPKPWEELDRCPHEDLHEPGRVHIDPLGYVYVCQGISIGNVFTTHLREICKTYVPETHPIASPLLDGGPAELARRYAVPHASQYVDACHLCYETRLRLRNRFPELLAPDQVYGLF